jgi:hypothetical protein
LVPADVAPEDACLLPFVETAVNTVGCRTLGRKKALSWDRNYWIVATAILGGFPR